VLPTDYNAVCRATYFEIGTSTVPFLSVIRGFLIHNVLGMSVLG